VADYVAKNQLKIAVYSGLSADVRKTYTMGGTPQTIVVSPEGRVLQNWVGAYAGSQKSQVEAFFHTTLPGLIAAPEPSNASGYFHAESITDRVYKQGVPLQQWAPAPVPASESFFEPPGHYLRMKNITLSADEQLIEQARRLAKSQHKTLNAMFRDWLEQLAGQSGGTQEFDALMNRLKHVESGRRFSRDEMNELGSFSTQTSSYVPSTRIRPRRLRKPRS
jgi:hypothetical protein